MIQEKVQNTDSIKSNVYYFSRVIKGVNNDQLNKAELLSFHEKVFRFFMVSDLD